MTLEAIKFTEMNDSQRVQFRKEWVLAYAEGLTVECDTPLIEAYIEADVMYETWLNQEGYMGRDSRIEQQRGEW